MTSAVGPEPYPPCLCDDLCGDGLCLVCASTPEDREETPMSEGFTATCATCGPFGPFQTAYARDTWALVHGRVHAHGHVVTVP